MTQEAVVDATPLLRSIPLFEGLSTEDLSALAGALSRRSFQAGEMIFSQGDAGTAMYIVESGDGFRAMIGVKK